MQPPVPQSSLKEEGEQERRSNRHGPHREQDKESDAKSMAPPWSSHEHPGYPQAIVSPIPLILARVRRVSPLVGATPGPPSTRSTGTTGNRKTRALSESHEMRKTTPNQWHRPGPAINTPADRRQSLPHLARPPKKSPSRRGKEASSAPRWIRSLHSFFGF